jgi:hypothetical protein
MGDGSVSALGTKNSVITSVWPVRGTTGSTTEIWKTGQSTTYVSDDDGDLQMGTAPPTPRFTDNGDGTITDNLTGLMWVQDCTSLGATSWNRTFIVASRFNSDPAHFDCEGYTAAHADWRVPNRKELYSLVNLSQSGPALDSDHPFIDVNVNASYWSSTTYADDIGYAWHVDLRSGEIGSDFKVNSHRVTLVR